MDQAVKHEVTTRLDRAVALFNLANILRRQRLDVGPSGSPAVSRPVFEVQAIVTARSDHETDAQELESELRGWMECSPSMGVRGIFRQLARGNPDMISQPGAVQMAHALSAMPTPDRLAAIVLWASNEGTALEEIALAMSRFEMVMRERLTHRAVEAALERERGKS